MINPTILGENQLGQKQHTDGPIRLDITMEITLQTSNSLNDRYRNTIITTQKKHIYKKIYIYMYTYRQINILDLIYNKNKKQKTKNKNNQTNKHG